ncbi:MAG: hypothetical protein M5U13_07880 [Thermoanaerobaculia bacterium]|nr:hypothetical protein [Thermoanaerobaculia bacterium]
MRPQRSESISAIWMLGSAVSVELAGVVQSMSRAHSSSRSWPGRPAGPCTSVSRWRIRIPGVVTGGGVSSESAGVSAWKPKPERSATVKR